MKLDNILKAAGVAVAGAAVALSNQHIIDPSIAAGIGAVVNFIIGLFHSRPNHV